MEDEAVIDVESETGTQAVPFDKLSEDLMEEILSRLPYQSGVAASLVCKRWHSLLLPGAYCRQLALHNFMHRPWFFMVGLNHFLPAKNQAFGYDPELNQFRRFPSFEMPPYDHGSLTGTHGLLFALTGSGICKLGYNPCLINNSSWRETPPLLYSRRSPIAAMVTDPCSSIHGGVAAYHIVVAGGKSLDNQLVVEIYDSNVDAWRQCAPLPPEFQFSSSSQWMHSAVFDGKFIAYETHTGCMAWLDLNQGQWSTTAVLRPRNPVYCFLVACGNSLVLVALYRESPCFKLWSVNLATLQCTELGHMPDELFALFDEEDDEKDPLFTCVGGGDFIYIYSDSWHKDYLACACDLSGETVKWRKLPSLPSPVNRFGKVVCFSSSIMPDACV
ncbi:hypothetical protein L7F22_061265 [Adiantum nelumboides]|nr:hypothetical protein [Adiantum nelumboides]